MSQDVIIVPHLEFGRLRHEIATATDRFQQAAHEKQGLLVLFGTLPTITEEDRQEFQEQIEAEENAYEEIKDLHDKIVRLLREKPHAKAATNQG